MTPAEFIAKWGPGGPSAHLNEEQGAQSHFLDLCELLNVPKPGSGSAPGAYVFEQDAKALKQRTLTKLYNQRPAWLVQAHAALDAVVAAAYGWDDDLPDLSDAEILRRLLALNLQRASSAS